MKAKVKTFKKPSKKPSKPPKVAKKAKVKAAGSAKKPGKLSLTSAIAARLKEGLKKAVSKASPKVEAAKKPSKADLRAAAQVEKQKIKDQAKLQASKKVLAHPYQEFFRLWKPRHETFEAGIEKLLAEYPPAPSEEAEVRDEVTEKILAQMRKEPLPVSIEEQLGERYTRERIHKLTSIWSMKPKSSIRLNILKADLAGFAASETARDLKIKRSLLSPWAFDVTKPEELMAHPAYGRGLFEFQDEASQLIALLVNARPGQRILDLAAGDGSQMLAIAAMMKNKGSLFLYESDSKKAKILRERADRAGLENYRILSDSQVSEVKGLDAVLVDAPSSHLGGLAAHPELRWRFHKDDLGRLHKLQAALLREGARKLKLGGYLIYATRTLNRSENESQIDHFLKSTHSSYRLVPVSSYIREFVVPYARNFFGFEMEEKTLNSMLDSDPYFVINPDVHGGLSAFVGILQRVRIST